MIALADPAHTVAPLPVVLRRHWRAVSAGVLVLLAGGLIYGRTIRPPAVAEARVVVQNPVSDPTGLGAADPQSYFANQLALARLPAIVTTAISETDTRRLGATERSVRIKADPASDTIDIDASLPSGAEVAARRLADSVVQNYVASSRQARQQQAKSALSSVTESIRALNRSSDPSQLDGQLVKTLLARQTALSREAQAPISLLTFSDAENQASGKPGLSRILLMVMLGGLPLGVGIALARDGIRRRVALADEASAVTGLRVLARVPLDYERRQAANAALAALTPESGRLVAVALPRALARDQDRETPAELLARLSTSTDVVQLPFDSRSLHTVLRPGTRIILLIGPRTRVITITDAVKDLARLDRVPEGIVWTAPDPADRPNATQNGVQRLRRAAFPAVLS